MTDKVWDVAKWRVEFTSSKDHEQRKLYSRPGTGQQSAHSASFDVVKV